MNFRSTTLTLPTHVQPYNIHQPAPSSPSPNTPDAPTPDPEVPYSAFAAYGASKLANLLTAQHLDRQRLGWALAHPQAPPHATTATSGTGTAPIGTMPDNTLAGATASSSSFPPWDPSDQHVCVYTCTPGMVHTRGSLSFGGWCR